MFYYDGVEISREECQRQTVAISDAWMASLAMENVEVTQEAPMRLFVKEALRPLMAWVEEMNLLLYPPSLEE